MSKKLEVLNQILSRGPDGGNPTPRWQGHVDGKPVRARATSCTPLFTNLHREDVSGRSRRWDIVEAQAKDRKAPASGEPPPSGTSPVSAR